MTGVIATRTIIVVVTAGCVQVAGRGDVERTVSGAIGGEPIKSQHQAHPSERDDPPQEAEGAQRGAREQHDFNFRAIAPVVKPHLHRRRRARRIRLKHAIVCRNPDIVRLVERVIF